MSAFLCPRRFTLLATLLSGCAPIGSAAPDETGAQTFEIPDALMASLAEGHGVDVMVQLDARDTSARPVFPADLSTSRALFRERIRSRGDRVLADLPTIHPLAAYANFAVMVVHVDDLDDAAALAAHPNVISLEPVERLRPSLTESLGLIGQPAAAAAGYDGAGASIAILDTGADWTEADLGSCTSVGHPASCRVVYTAEITADDGSLDDFGHGTNVSSIAAAVAPGADILVFDVFGPDGTTTSTDIFTVLDWLIDHQAEYNVASINMSFGGGEYTAPCTGAYSAAIGAARDAGMSVVVSSGNAGFVDAIEMPSCVEEAISVGAVYDAALGTLAYADCTDTGTLADQVTCFSNTAPFLDILAPGAMITAGGHTMAGTSMAAPHVAGALATLRAADPYASVTELEERLLSQGTMVTDPRTELMFPRLNIDPAPADEEGPVGSISIEAGTEWTNTWQVQVSLAASDESGVTRVCLSNTPRCLRWFDMSDTLTWTMSGGSGVRRVYAWFEDGAGNVSAEVSDGIGVDASPPFGGSVAAYGSPGQLSLRWGGFDDDVSGVAGYRVVYDAAPPALGCTSGTVGYEGGGDHVLLEGLPGNTITYARACAFDRAGNVGEGILTFDVGAPSTFTAR